MLGFIHKVVLGKAPKQFLAFFPLSSGSRFPRDLRVPEARHNCQLHDPMDGTQTNMMKRSVFRLIYPYNMLPQRVVDSTTVSSFQQKLQQAVKAAARDGRSNWQYVFRNGVFSLSAHSFQQCFSMAPAVA
ncbi:unnamed protein product [Polarella glacialis]|uniref:Uncharacterized protein n=1 Tax=Polarella glacialis TaxID=89957 RepID=A0A813GNT4_POLGL|nr:unnamed protein product [Polarella glacialis]